MNDKKKPCATCDNQDDGSAESENTMSHYVECMQCFGYSRWTQTKKDIGGRR